MTAGKLPIILLGLWIVGRAQGILEPAAAGRLQESLAGRPELSRGCKLSRTGPTLAYSLHYESGYALEPRPGAGHGISVLLQVRPEGGMPVYLLRRHNLMDDRGMGTFRVGEGSYEVTAWAFDDTHRLCQGRWRIHVRPNGRERALAMRMPPHSVAPLAVAASGRPPASMGRLTVLLHAAALNPRLSIPSPADAAMLTGMLSALVEKLPAREVRLVVFSLARREELLRSDQFRPEELEKVSHVLGGLQLGTVDIQTLENRRGHLDFLTELLKRELSEGDPAGAVVLMGPPAVTHDQLAAQTIQPRRAGPLFYLECVIGPTIRTPATAMEPVDTLRSTVEALEGRTFPIGRPEDFAAAVEQMVSSLPHSKL
jgi:hypothetical protein